MATARGDRLQMSTRSTHAALTYREKRAGVLLGTEKFWSWLLILASSDVTFVPDRRKFRKMNGLKSNFIPSPPPLTPAEEAALAPLRPQLRPSAEAFEGEEVARRPGRKERAEAQWWNAFFAEFGGNPKTGARG